MSYIIIKFNCIVIIKLSLIEIIMYPRINNYCLSFVLKIYYDE